MQEAAGGFLSPLICSVSLLCFFYQGFSEAISAFIKPDCLPCPQVGSKKKIIPKRSSFEKTVHLGTADPPPYGQVQRLPFSLLPNGQNGHSNCCCPDMKYTISQGSLMFLGTLYLTTLQRAAVFPPLCSHPSLAQGVRGSDARASITAFNYY